MNFRAISTVAAVSMLTLACTQQAESPDAASTNNALGASTIEAENGMLVPESLFRYYALNAVRKEPEDLTPEERQAVIDSLVTLELLADAAEERGLPQERTVAVELELQRLQLLGRTMVNRFIEENPVTEAELQEEYATSMSQVETTEHKARHILLESQEEASAVIEELRGGADFTELAEQHSTDSTGPAGGDLGWFTADSMVEPFAQAVSGMEVGSFSSEPVQTQFGWHVILVEDRRTSEPPGLDAVRDEVTDRATQRKIEAYIESLRDSA